jgi:hypothetical protein
MIVHLAPRRVTLVSKEDGRQTGSPIDLNAVLAVDIEPGPAQRLSLIVRLTNGERVIACTYSQMAEAGPDCGRLRVLAGLPAWDNATETPVAPVIKRSRHRLLTATAAMVLIAALVALVLALSDLHGVGVSPT